MCNQDSLSFMYPHIIEARVITLKHPLEVLTKGMPRVEARFTNNPTKWVKVLEFEQSEISFTPEELRGLTASECGSLHFKKDKEYLQS